MRLRYHLLFLLLTFSQFTYSQSSRFLEGELYLKINSSVSKEYFLYLLKESGALDKFQIKEVTSPFSGVNEILDKTHKLSFGNHYLANELINLISGFSFIEYVEKVPIHKISYTPDDILLPKQWNLQKINAFAGWDITQGSMEIVIAIIDNGVRISHQDLQSNIWINLKEIPNNFIDDDLNGYIDDVRGYDVADLDNDPSPPRAATDSSEFVHGTHVAGIAGAATDNNFGVASLGFNCFILPVKCAADNSDGTTLVNAYEGVLYAIRAGAQIINMSFGTEDKTITGQNIMNAAYNQGIFLVAAAGNEKTDSPSYPAAFEHVISVGATDQTDKVSSFSNFGTTIDVMAPGSRILSTLSGTDLSFGFMSGTSMACPHVAALAGLVLSMDKELSPDQVELAIKNGCENIDQLNPDFSGKLGAGRINVQNTLSTIPEKNNKMAEENKLLVFPNPNAGIFKVAIGKGTQNGKLLRVSSILGKVIYEESLSEEKHKNSLRLDLSGQPSGIYLVQLLDGANYYDVQKVVIY